MEESIELGSLPTGGQNRLDRERLGHPRGSQRGAGGLSVLESVSRGLCVGDY